MTEANRLDELLTLLIENKSADDWECLNRLEQYLVCILTKGDISLLGEPMNRLEVLLQALYYVVPEGTLEIISTRLEEQQEP